MLVKFLILIWLKMKSENRGFIRENDEKYSKKW